jgi:hypothetical protein
MIYPATLYNFGRVCLILVLALGYGSGVIGV